MTTDIEKAREAVAAILQAREKCIEAEDQRLYQIQELVAECLRFGDKTHG